MNYIILSDSAKAALELVSAAKASSADTIEAIVFTAADAEVVAQTGINAVTVAQVPEGALKESVAAVVIEKAKSAGQAVVLISSSRRMVNAAGQIAQALGTAPVVDAKAVNGVQAAHALYGGKLIVTEGSTGSYLVAVVQGATYEPAPATETACSIETVAITPLPGATVTGLKAKEITAVDPTQAKTVVCIGRGVATREGFDLCVALKNAVGGELACTRPVCETEDPLLPHEVYIGASGITVKPNLYIGIATSGQTQHTMGMYESGKVVVIDKNAGNFFFENADYYIVGDYQDIVPAITRALA